MQAIPRTKAVVIGIAACILMTGCKVSYYHSNENMPPYVSKNPNMPDWVYDRDKRSCNSQARTEEFKTEDVDHAFFDPSLLIYQHCMRDHGHIVQFPGEAPGTGEKYAQEISNRQTATIAANDQSYCQRKLFDYEYMRSCHQDDARWVSIADTCAEKAEKYANLYEKPGENIYPYPKGRTTFPTLRQALVNECISKDCYRDAANLWYGGAEHYAAVERPNEIATRKRLAANQACWKEAAETLGQNELNTLKKYLDLIEHGEQTEAPAPSQPVLGSENCQLWLKLRSHRNAESDQGDPPLDPGGLTLRALPR